ncbi:hypothetical protein JCM10450v2_006960 [Rhodotorula kratochvilovae]
MPPSSSHPPAAAAAALEHPPPPPPPQPSRPTPALAPTTPPPPASLPASAHAHLLVLAAVVLIGGGYLVYSLAPRYRRPSAPRSARHQNALKTIRLAQEAAASDEPGPSSAHKPQSDAGGAAGASSASSAGGAGPLKLVTAGLPSSSSSPGGAALSELLPSPACVTSTSAAILSGLEKIGSVVGAATAGARARARSVSSSVKGKERVTDDAEEDDAPPSSALTASSATTSLAVPPSPVVNGLTRRGKGKKGVKAGMLSPTGSSTSSVASPSQKGSRSPARRLSVREIGVGSDRVATSESGVQTSGVLPPSHGRLDSDPTPRHHTPSEPPDPPPPSTADAGVQTSPRLLPVASSSPAAPTAPDPLPAPAARPAILPLPFDLHASFQSTPLAPPPALLAPPCSSSSAASSSSSSSYPAPASPPLSPRACSRSPNTIASASASPSSRRAASPAPTPGTSRRASATHLAAPAPAPALTPVAGEQQPPPPSRPRSARRKSGVAAAAGAPAPAADEPPARGVVGLPGAVAAPRRGPKDEGPKGKKEKEKEKARDEELALRRLSTASSSASGASARSGKGGKAREKEKEREEETVRAVQQGAGAGARRKQLQGLGVGMGMDDDGGVGGDGAQPDGYFPFPPPANGVRTPSWTSPESSPHPSQRSASLAHAAGTQQRPPWSPQLMAQQYTMIPAPPGTRPPSRGNSLSVPPSGGMAPSTPLHGPSPAQLQQQQVQQVQAAQQQQQQTAYALAHAHAQAQVQAQYQHAIALQLQAQQQQQQQQLVQRQQLQRRRSTMPAPGDDSDGFLSPSATATPATPSGFVYPLSSVTSPPLGANGAGGGTGAMSSPLLASFGAPSHLQPQQHPISSSPYGVSQGVSPTSGSFPASVQAAHAAAVAAAMYPYASAPSPAGGGGGGYLASPSPSGSYAHGVHASPTQAHFAQAQLARPPRPRLQSSASAVAALGSGSGAQANGHSLGLGGKQPPRSAGEKLRAASAGAPPSPGAASSSSSAPMSGGVQLGDPPGGMKTRLKQAELDADRTAKELEIARWKLAVLEDDQRAAEIENQEALRALATRAMRAEARIKLLEDAARTQQQSSELPSSSPSSSFPSTSNSPVTQVAQLPTASLAPAMPDFGGPSSPSSGIHPLSWLDLDAVSFNGPRALNPPRSPNFPASPNGGSSKWRNKRNSNGFNGGRRLGGGQRRKSSASPSAPVPPPEIVDSEDDDVLIVLDAPMRRRSVYPRQQTPSRRSSYAPDEDGLEHEVSSFVDDDEIPSIDIADAEPIAGGAVMGESDDGTRQHPEYIGFLPSHLSPHRAPPSLVGSPVFDAVECSAFVADDADTSGLSLPSFTLDASPALDDCDDAGSMAPVLMGMTAPIIDEGDSPQDSPVQQAPVPSSAREKALLRSPAESDQQTPRMAPPPSPPTSPSPSIPRISTPRQRSRSPGRRRPEDTPLPPSPLVQASA